MNVLARTEYSLRDKCLDVFVCGCSRKCKGCFNEELWDFNYGVPVSHEWWRQLEKKVQENTDLIQGIRVLGGDLLCQDATPAIEFSLQLKESFPSKLLILFTGASKEEVPSWAKKIYNAIKVGEFREDEYSPEHYLASTNQQYLLKGVDYI